MPSAYAKRDQKPDRQQSNELAVAVAMLAGRQTDQASRKLTGRERAAVLMLVLGNQYGSKLWTLLDDDELRELSIVMSTLGTIGAPEVEALLLEFVSLAP